MTPPRFTIILISYNQQDYVRAAVESVLRSSFRLIEVVCVDDGSDDETSQILRAIALTDDRVRLLVLEHSGRPAVARNAGLALAQGDYICFLDGDDIVHASRFAMLDEASRMPGGEIDVLFHDYADFPDGTVPEDGRKRLCGTSAGASLRALSSGQIAISADAVAYTIPSHALAEFLLARYFVVNTGTVCVRRSHLERRHIAFPTDRVLGEDTVVWMRCILDARVVLIDRCLFYWRKYPGSLTATRTAFTQRELVRSLRELLALVQPHLPPRGLSAVRSRIFEEAREVGMLLEGEGKRWAAARAYLSAAHEFRRPSGLLRALKALGWPATGGSAGKAG